MEFSQELGEVTNMCPPVSHFGDEGSKHSGMTGLGAAVGLEFAGLRVPAVPSRPLPSLYPQHLAHCLAHRRLLVNEF